MPSKKHRPEEIIGKLREAEVVLAQGATTAEACRRIAVSEQTYYRWRKEYGGLKTDQARRMKDLEIGRASCRERVCQYVSISVVAVSLKKQRLEEKGTHSRSQVKAIEQQEDRSVSLIYNL